MSNTSPRVDAYIKKAAPFAQPILEKIRATYHKACPEIEENIKWGVPSFEKHGIVGVMAAFKQHVSMGFMKAGELSDHAGLFEEGCGNQMSAVKFKNIKDMPTQKVLVSYIKEAVTLNEAAAKTPASKKKRKKTTKKKSAKRIKAPADLSAALKKNTKAMATFDGFSYSNRKDYVEWITDAKQPATRERRIKQAIEWMAEGKPRNWKYMKNKTW